MARRKLLEGVFNVVRFNWPLYVTGVSICFIAWVATISFPISSAIKGVTAFVGSIALYFVVMSLIASYLAYDASGLYDFAWLNKLLKQTPHNIVNLHAGFDETSESLKLLFPNAQLSVLDFYDPSSQTEPSLLRARKLSRPALKARKVGITDLTLPDSSMDLALLCFCAHEVRNSFDRERLFRELNRIVKPDGWVILVEHMRDIANFLAFGPGFMHFLPCSEWRRLTSLAGLKIEKEFSITPFVRILCLCRT